MTPGVGRIVHFHEEGGPYASLVTAINHDDGTLELCTFGKNSIYFQHRVSQVDQVYENDPPKNGTWTWPPRAP